MQKQKPVEQNYKFPVSMMDVFLKDGTAVKHAKAVVRTDTNEPIATVGPNYELVPHAEAFAHVQPFINKFGKPEVKHFVEKGGARVLAEYTFRDNMKELKEVGDRVALRINVINSYNLSTSLLFRIGGMVLSCLNGAMLMRGELEFNYRHNKSIRDLELPDPETIEMIFDDTTKLWKAWGSLEAGQERKEKIRLATLERGVMGSKIYKSTEDKFESSKTYWELYNAYTYGITHCSEAMQTSKLQRFQRLNKIFTSVQ